MNENNYLIRNMEIKDIDKIASLYCLFWNDKMNTSRMKEKFLLISSNPNYIFLVAEKSGDIVGTIQGIICEELYGECRPFLVMENFVVDAKFRGNGIGKRLLNSLEIIGKEKKCSQIIFITETNRKDSIKFYEQVGFDSMSHKGFKKSLR